MTTTVPTKDQNHSHGEHAEHPDHRMFGLATFLVADAMTFAGFFAAYLTFKAVNPLPDGAIYELELPLPILNTVLLLVSSATFHRAGQAIHLVQHALQPVQVFILRPRACWLSRVGRQVDDLAGSMALNGGSPALWSHR